MQCNSFTSGNDIFHIGTNFGGIPSTLLTNFLLWVLILALFFFARKSLFVLVTDNIGQNWTRIFRLLYSQSDNEVECEDSPDEVEWKNVIHLNTSFTFYFLAGLIDYFKSYVIERKV